MQRIAAASLLAALAVACGGNETTMSSASSAGPSSASSASASSSSGSSSGGGGGSMMCGDDVAPPNEVLPDTTDPEKGMFTLDEALVELPQGPGPLRALVDTDLGLLTCTMHDVDVPNAVANFIGLARGRRA